MSKLGATALAVAIGYLLFRLLLGSAKLLYLICKMAVLLPIALVGLAAGTVQVRRGVPTKVQSPVIQTRSSNPPVPRYGRVDPEASFTIGEPIPDPAPSSGTGDWKQDQETLRRLLAEGQIKTTPKG